MTKLNGEAQALYEKLYGARGEREKRIKAQQLAGFADRARGRLGWPNPFRWRRSTLAYTRVNALRRSALQPTELAPASGATIRLKLFKIGAVVVIPAGFDGY